MQVKERKDYKDRTSAQGISKDEGRNLKRNRTSTRCALLQSNDFAQKI
jgi:hypothetical protein